MGIAGSPLMNKLRNLLTVGTYRKFFDALNNFFYFVVSLQKAI